MVHASAAGNLAGLCWLAELTFVGTTLVPSGSGSCRARAAAFRSCNRATTAPALPAGMYPATLPSSWMLV